MTEETIYWFDGDDEPTTGKYYLGDYKGHPWGDRYEILTYDHSCKEWLEDGFPVHAPIRYTVLED